VIEKKRGGDRHDRKKFGETAQTRSLAESKVFSKRRKKLAENERDDPTLDANTSSEPGEGGEGVEGGTRKEAWPYPRRTAIQERGKGKTSKEHEKSRNENHQVINW